MPEMGVRRKPSKASERDAGGVNIRLIDPIATVPLCALVVNPGFSGRVQTFVREPPGIAFERPQPGRTKLLPGCDERLGFEVPSPTEPFEGNDQQAPQQGIEKSWQAIYTRPRRSHNP